MPWVGPKDLHVRFVEKAEESVTEAGESNGTRVVPEGTVLMVVRSMGLANGLQIALTLRPVAFNQDVKALVPIDGISARYLFYALWGFHDQIHGLVDEASHGTKRLRSDVLGAFAVPLPPPEEQDRIVAVLGALDDKIESNRRLATLLEETAAALFRARFIDFVGVTDLTDSEIGRRPAAWPVRPLSDLTLIVRGISYRSADFGPSEVALIGLKAIQRGGGYVSRGLREYAGPFREEHLLSPGDILVAHTDLTQAADVLGAAARVPTWEPHAKLVPTLDLAIVRPRRGLVTEEFLLGVLGSAAFRSHARAHSSGTTVLHLPREAVGAFLLAVPPHEQIEEYTAEARPMLLLADSLQGESRTLADLRDSLLPKLVSGQIRVREAEEMAEAV